MKNAFAGRPFTVHLQLPKIEGFDLAFVSRHDWKNDMDQRANYLPMIGVPHRLNRVEIIANRNAARSKWAPDDRRAIVVVVGGPNGAYVYDEASKTSLIRAINDLADQGWRVLVTASRRTDPETTAALRALPSTVAYVWDRSGENPYLEYLAAADAFLITKDSITMPCEALITGKPVYILGLAGQEGRKLAKFERFHSDMEETLGLTRTFRGEIADYIYEPLDETTRVASIVQNQLTQ